MTEPEDFGLPPVRTLAHLAADTPAPGHNAFWQALIADLARVDPDLAPTSSPDPSDPTQTHKLWSLPQRDPSRAGDAPLGSPVRLGASLLDPPKGVEARAGLVALHGYATPSPLSGERDRWRAVTDRGVRVLAIRVRGYPGSSRDVGDWLTPSAFGGGWITRGLDRGASDAEGPGARAWSLIGAVADVLQAVRALRATLPVKTPIALAGESFGAGLATIAAGLLERDAPVQRLAIALPSLGNWAWRFEQATLRRGTGTGWEIGLFMEHHRDWHDGVERLLRLTDAAIHARQVECPVLCKLAMRDDVVPAPAAAAVFNALGAAPGLKWRFVVPYGHFDGGLSASRRHVLFERCRAAFLDPRREPTESMLDWEPHMEAGDQGPPGETVRETQPALFAADPARPPPDDARLIAAYAQAGRTLDDLPYTAEFESICTALGSAASDRRAVLHRLHNLRKAGRLPKLGRPSGKPPAISPEEEGALSALVSEACGGLGKRDRLPYAPEFDTVAERFQAATGRAMQPHDLWRLIAKLAK